MESLFLASVLLACPVGMGVMMLTMRGRHAGGGTGEPPQVAQLRAEIDQLKTERDRRRPERIRSENCAMASSEQDPEVARQFAADLRQGVRVPHAQDSPVSGRVPTDRSGPSDAG